MAGRILRPVQAVRLTERFGERPAIEAEQTTPRDERLESRSEAASAASVEAELEPLDETVDGDDSESLLRGNR